MCTFKKLEEIWKTLKKFEKTSGNPVILQCLKYEIHFNPVSQIIYNGKICITVTLATFCCDNLKDNT